jgi:serine/threonine-protein kinase
MSPDAGQPGAPVSIGDVLAGKYRVERIMGQGGMGVVVAARHAELGELRALKLMLPGAAASAEAVDRFMREARAAARLRSEHVTRVHDVGRLESGAPYIVMEYLEGSDLQQLLEARGTIRPEDAVGYVLQACEAVGEAHAAGIVHRDLKPANLFLTRAANGAPCIKVLDFGIAKLGDVAPGAVAMTAATQMLGTPLYMSPEQMKSAHDVDARTDVWSLGAILYRMLAGKTAFDGNSIAELYGSMLTEDPSPIARCRADVPPALEAVVMRCLQKQPDARYANASELGAALLPFVAPLSAGASAPATPAPSAPLAAAAVSTPTMPAPSAQTAAAWATPTGPVASGPAGYVPGPAAAAAWPGAPVGTPAVTGPQTAPSAMAYSAGASAPRARRWLWFLLGLGVLGGAAVGIAWAVGLSDDGPRRGGRADSSASGKEQNRDTSAAPSAEAEPTSAGTGRTGTKVGPTSGQPTAPTGRPTSGTPTTAGATTTAAAPSGKAAGALRQVALGCWRDTEGSKKGQPADSATITLTVGGGGSRTVAVSGAQACRGFRACVVNGAAGVPVEPAESPVVVTVALKAGPS